MQPDRLHNSFEYAASENQIAAQAGLTIGHPKTNPSLRVLRHWLSETAPETGSRLPPERKLAETLNLSRPELRKALAVLETEGRIHRHVGRGTFVIKPPPLPISLPALTDRTGPHDVMIARITLEPELAQLAALHATPLQISRAKALCTDIRNAATWEAYAHLDYTLHDLIAQSAGNILLHELHKIMNAVRQVAVWRHLPQDVAGPPPDYHSFEEHDAIVTAIANRDRAAARSAMRKHLNATLNAMTAEV